MIIVISNRIVDENRNDESFFGETLNPQGADKIRIAKAEYHEGNKWVIEAIPEDDNLINEYSSGRQLFLEIMNGIENNNYRKKWVIYNPGFNQSSRSALDASQKLADKYKVDVILFSWPSNPNGNSNSILESVNIESEYREALSIAKDSAKALTKVFTSLGKFITDYSFDIVPRRHLKLTLLNHSLGNHVLENQIRLQSDNVVEIFDNIILQEPDVDSEKHEEWVNNIELTKNVYVTINRDDYVLTASGLFHQSRLNSLNGNNRLGNNTKNFPSPKPAYVNFTGGIKVVNAHNLFFEVDNAVVVNFFKQIFKGNSPISSSLVFKRLQSESNVHNNVFYLDQ